MIIGFAIYWVPFVWYIGGVLLLAGVVFLWFGRRAFNEAHRRWVAWGTALLFAGLIGSLAVSALFSILVNGGVVSPGETSSQALAALQQALDVYVLGSLLVAIVAALGFVALPYGRADLVSRIILWSGFAISVILSIALFVTLWTEFTAVITSASNGAIDTAPIMDVQGQLLQFGVAQVVADLLFMWGYLRIRSRLFPGGKKAMRASILRDLRSG